MGRRGGGAQAPQHRGVERGRNTKRNHAKLRERPSGRNPASDQAKSANVHGTRVRNQAKLERRRRKEDHTTQDKGVCTDQLAPRPGAPRGETTNKPKPKGGKTKSGKKARVRKGKGQGNQTPREKRTRVNQGAGQEGGGRGTEAPGTTQAGEPQRAQTKERAATEKGSKEAAMNNAVQRPRVTAKGPAAAKGTQGGLAEGKQQAQTNQQRHAGRTPRRGRKTTKGPSNDKGQCQGEA